MAEDDSTMKLEGGSGKPLNNMVLSPIVIQNDAYAVPNTVKLNGSNSLFGPRLRQEGRPVGVYYADLKSVWQKLDQQRPIKMECAADLKTFREEIQIDRVYVFLVGLDDLFDKVRSDILRTQPLPFVEEVFSVVRREA
ncbi:unnamed protein product [Malus baccata var. baccata]